MKNSIPSSSVFWISLGVLFLYLTIDFTLTAHRMFHQLNFDWKQLSVIKEVEKVTIDSLSNNYLELKKNKELSLKELNPNNTFCLSDENCNYFRATSIDTTSVSIQFKGIKWINGYRTINAKEVAFQIIDLPFIQKGEKTVTTLGDSHISWRDGREFRKILSEKNRSIIFKGNSIDVNGFPSEADVFLNAREILEKLPAMEDTDYYVLFFGAHDRNTDRNQLKEEVCEIISTLGSRKETEKIIVVTLPPSMVSEVQKHNLDFNKILKECASTVENTVVVDLQEKLKDANNFLFEDEVHLNTNGQYILAKLISKELK